MLDVSRLVVVARQSITRGDEELLEFMLYREVGAGKKISQIGLGTSQFGSEAWGYGASYAEHEARLIVRRAVELGITLFDTAAIYGDGRSERILGQALGEDRASVFLATKAHPILPPSFRLRQRAAASASRLGVARLDLYQMHWPNVLAGDGSVMRQMRRLQQDGLIAEVGVSNYSLARWRKAESSLGGRILSNQVAYNLVDRAAEANLAFARDHGRLIIAHSPLAQGLLSGKYDKANRPSNARRADLSYFTPGTLDRIDGLMKTLREIAHAHSVAVAQIALAWVIHDPVVVAIPGASSVAQLENNVAATEIELKDDEYQALDLASKRVVAAAERTGRRQYKISDNVQSVVESAFHGWHVAKTVHGGKAARTSVSAGKG
jgi:aryl-alcohol dehydrogenase-like predicted oxidoreductase